MKFYRLGLIAVLAFLLFAPLQAAQGAQSVNNSFRAWESASSELGFQGNLFKPRFSAGLKLSDKIHVLAFGKTGESSRDYNYRMTSVNAVYGNFSRGFSVDQKWSGTAWAATPQFDLASRPVGTFRASRVENGRLVKVDSRFYANCDTSFEETGTVQRKKCGKRDIRRFGGYATLKLLSINSLGGVRGTDIVIQSKGLSFSQLMRIVRGMEKVD